ncbi:class I SAM-dependent methyltransferase [Mariprofundus ferrooxydans]|uniref:class I SAM-dependent methyltransferase n=1 Tax=Mariprofundus ferrooxydans TaxID=314344 RepID=UPI001430738E|nr:class I SAM-dependent methyltransferase [Mariprofundus ferrooxydans]
MHSIKCNVCDRELEKVLYESGTDRSLTSLCQIYPGVTRVRVCQSCAHLQSDEIENVEAYYDQDYMILVESEEEDQVYEIRNGKPYYRTDHQVVTFLDKLLLPEGAKLLDYGCAKSSTIKALAKERPDIIPHLFDVSERYVPFWEKFVSSENWATYEPQSGWVSYFDVVTSFFSLEHIVKPMETLRGIVDLLKPGGKFYCIVPNVFTNIADFIVIDHVNHFTKPSFTSLLESVGLRLIEIDDESHRGAFVVVAEKPDRVKTLLPTNTSTEGVNDTLVELSRIADFWKVAGINTANFEATINEGEAVAIYGAGFYGAFISANLMRPENVSCFLDQNPYLQGRQLNGKQIVPPADLPEEVHTLLVGLNPAYARQIVSDIPVLQKRELRYFYL